MFAPFDDATYNRGPDLAGVCSALLRSLINHIVADRADNDALQQSNGPISMGGFEKPGRVVNVTVHAAIAPFLLWASRPGLGPRTVSLYIFSSSLWT